MSLPIACIFLAGIGLFAWVRLAPIGIRRQIWLLQLSICLFFTAVLAA